MKAENFVIICAVAGTFLFWVQAILGVLLDFSYYSSAEYRLRRLLQRQSKRQISWWEVILFLVAGMFIFVAGAILVRTYEERFASRIFYYAAWGACFLLPAVWNLLCSLCFVVVVRLLTFKIPLFPKKKEHFASSEKRKAKNEEKVEVAEIVE